MPRRRNSAFTLVEILVVMGIIGILIALLLPVVSKARASANRTKCLANLRELGQACRLYSSDHGDYTIPTNCGGDRWNYILVHLKYLSNPNPNRYPPYDRSSLFLCPDSPEVLLGGSDSSDEITSEDGCMACPSKFLQPGPEPEQLFVPCSYGINATGGEEYANYPIQPMCRLRKSAQLPHPSELVFLFDGVIENPHITPPDLTYLSRIVGRHGKPVPGQPGRSGQTNILFFDGHCETVERVDLPNSPDELIGEATATFIPWEQHPHPRWRVDQP